jgi:long-subunit acyl-CoA synthetase (AMP-forming)
LLERAAQASDQHAVAVRRSDDVAVIIYTSGTTGRSKGAMLTQASTSTSAFAATAGVLVAASSFTADRVMLAGDVLNVSYAINIAAA